MKLRHLTGVITLLLTACAVKPIDPQGKAIPDQPGCTDSSGVCEALKLADGYRRGYLKRADQIGSTREIGGLLTIGAATTALYYGLEARQQFRDRVHRLGSLSAGAYAAGMWVLPISKQEIYLEGAHAMTCFALAVHRDAIAPEELAQLQDATDQLRTALDGLRFLQQLESEEKQAELRPLLLDAETLLKAAESTIARSRQDGKIAKETVTKIDIEVRRLLLTHSPDFRALHNLIGGLTQSAAHFGAGRLAPTSSRSATETPVTAQGSDATETPSTGGKDAERSTKLLNARTKLLEESNKVANLLDRLRNLTLTEESLKHCLPKYAGGFSISPSVTVLTLRVQQPYQLVICDPVGRPQVNVVGEQSGAVELKTLEVGKHDDEYLLTLNPKTATTGAGGPILSIRSANRSVSHDIPITVLAGGEKSPAAVTENAPKTTPKSAKEPRSEYEKRLFSGSQARETILAVQCLVKDSYPANTFDPDCRMGPNTRAAIRKHRNDSKDEIDAQLRDEAYAALPDLPDRCQLPKEQRCQPEPTERTP